MKKVILIFLSMTIIACKSEKKEKIVDLETKDVIKEIQIQTFEDKLLDLRNINTQFNNDYKIDKFGVNKINDSIYALVFKLNQETTSETVNAHSIGIKCYYLESDKPIKSTYSPEIKNIDDDDFIILLQNFKSIRYLDSIDTYIYARNNWKASGRQGGFKVRDILFEDKK